MTTQEISTLRTIASRLRVHSLRSTSEAGSGHPTSCLSAAELVSAVFFHSMRFDPADPANPNTDRFVLSKGHAAPVLYAALAGLGRGPSSRCCRYVKFRVTLKGIPRRVFLGLARQPARSGKGFPSASAWRSMGNASINLLTVCTSCLAMVKLPKAASGKLRRSRRIINWIILLPLLTLMVSGKVSGLCMIMMLKSMPSGLPRSVGSVHGRWTQFERQF